MRRSPGLVGVNVCRLEDRCVPAIFVVNSNADTDDANKGDGFALDNTGHTTLRAAVQEANALAGQSEETRQHQIQFNTAMTVSLNSSMEPFTADIGVIYTPVIAVTDGDPPPLPAPVVIQGDGTFRLFKIESGSSSSFDGRFQITGGNAVFDYGGAFRVEGSLGLTGCEIYGNSARYGGGISVDTGSTLSVSGCSIHSNHSQMDGAGLINYGTTYITSATEIFDNTADGLGGGIFSGSGGDTAVSGNSDIFENTAGENGGGVYNMSMATFTMSGGSIFLNEATGKTQEGNFLFGLGGGVYNAGAGGIVTLTGVTIERNTAGGWGGAMYLAVNSSTSLNNCTIQQNTAAMGAKGIAFEMGAAPVGAGNTWGAADQEPVEV